MNEEFHSSHRRRRSLDELARCYCGGSTSKNQQETATTTSTSVADSRKAVGDQGVLNEGGKVDQSVNDNRTFDDHSVFSVDGSNRSVDNSQTYVTTADPEIAKANAAAAQTAFEQSADIAKTALGVTARAAQSAFESNANAIGQSLDAVSKNNLSAFEFARGSNSDSLAVATRAFEDATSLITQDAAASRDFAGQFVGRVFDSQKSADQANVETLTKAATSIAIAFAVALGLRALAKK